LEKEIDGLENKFQGLSEDLAGSRSAHSKDLADWKKLEARYKDTIRRLQKGGMTSNMVPMGLFKLVKNESDSRLKEIRILQKKVVEQEQSLKLRSQQNFDPYSGLGRSSLPKPKEDRSSRNVTFKESESGKQIRIEMARKEDALNESHAPKATRNARVTISNDDGKENHAGKRIVVQNSGKDNNRKDVPKVSFAFVSPEEQKENSDGSKPIRVRFALSEDGRKGMPEGHGSGKSLVLMADENKSNVGKIRVNMVRKEGGRKGLQEKLKQMRSPHSSKPLRKVTFN
jgi:hypothetical protein